MWRQQLTAGDSSRTDLPSCTAEWRRTGQSFAAYIRVLCCLATFRMGTSGIVELLPLLPLLLLLLVH